MQHELTTERKLKKIWDIISQLDKFDQYSQTQLVDSFTYSMLMCFSHEQLTELFFEYIEETKIRRKIEGIIKKRIQVEGSNNFQFLIERIYDEIPKLSWINYTRVRAFFAEIIVDFPKEYLVGFYIYFSKSEKVSDNKKAFKVVKLIWSKEIEESLWTKFYDTFDENCLDVLIDNSNTKALVEIFPVVWSNNFSDYIKRKLLKKIAPANFDEIKFIEKDTPVSYLYAVVLADKTINRKQVIKLALNVKNIKEFRFVLWCLGKMKMFDCLVEIANHKIKNPDSQDFFSYFSY